MDHRICRLKAAYDAGYDHTEAADEAQAPFTWQNKVCQHCPFGPTTTVMCGQDTGGPLDS